jgi:hypothetical protein
VVEQAVIALARAVFANGGRIVFGAHPSISPLVASVASEYQLAGPPEGQRRVIIYQSKAFEKALPNHTWDLYRFGFADLVWTDAKGGEFYVPGDAASRKCPLSLTEMRTRMIGEIRPQWMVVIGGMEGVFEEVELFEKRSRTAPVFAARESGGVARQIAEQRERYPRVRVLEDGWREAGGVTPPQTDDPRDIPMPPYPAIMQWLVGDLVNRRQEAE